MLFSSTWQIKNENTEFSGSPRVTGRSRTLAPLSSPLQTPRLHKAEAPQALSIGRRTPRVEGIHASAPPLLLPRLLRFFTVGLQSSLSVELTLHSSCLECDQEAYLSAKVGKMTSAYTNSKHSTAALIATENP